MVYSRRRLNSNRVIFWSILLHIRISTYFHLHKWWIWFTNSSMRELNELYLDVISPSLVYLLIERNREWWLWIFRVCWKQHFLKIADCWVRALEDFYHLCVNEIRQIVRLKNLISFLFSLSIIVILFYVYAYAVVYKKNETLSLEQSLRGAGQVCWLVVQICR